MIKATNIKKSIRGRSAVFFTAGCLALSNTVAVPFLPAQTAPAVSYVRSEIEIPEELGRIEAQHLSAGDRPFVFFIQDAHAVIDAQDNIRRLIEYTEKKYGVTLVGIEGGDGRLDPTLLRSFPDSFVRTRVLRDYLERGELSGGSFSAAQDPGRAEYYGIEDWDLYEQNYIAYLKAMLEKDAVLSRLAELRRQYDRQRPAVYSAELNSFHEHVQAFWEERSHLLDLAKELSVLITKGNILDSGSLQTKYPQMASFFEAVDANAIMDVDLSTAIRRMGDSFSRKYASRLDREALKEFNGQYQAFITGQADPGKFLQYMVEAGRSLGLNPKLTPGMRKLIGHTEKLSHIKGSRLFDELTSLLKDIENRLLDTPRQRELAYNYETLRLLEEMAGLEISRARLAEYQQDAGRRLAVAGPEMRDRLKPALIFYHFALERDQAFHRNLESLLEKTGAKAAVVLSGGFHRDGFEQLLREKGYSYAVITPRIDSLEGHQSYHSVMQGRLSYGDLLDDSFYEAFMMHSSASLMRELNEPDFRRTMKIWRDEIIRSLAAEGRVAEAGEYTRFVDALARLYQKKFKEGEARPFEAIQKDLLDGLNVFESDGLEGFWERFDARADALLNQMKGRFFPGPGGTGTSGLQAGQTVDLFIRGSSNRSGVLYEVNKRGWRETALKSELRDPSVSSLPAVDLPTLRRFVGDRLQEGSDMNIREIPAFGRLRSELRTALEAGRILGRELGSNPETQAILDRRIEEIIDSQPGLQREILRRAVLQALREEFNLDGAESGLEIPAASEGPGFPAGSVIVLNKEDNPAETGTGSAVFRQQENGTDAALPNRSELRSPGDVKADIDREIRELFEAGPLSVERYRDFIASQAAAMNIPLEIRPLTLREFNAGMFEDVIELWKKTFQNLRAGRWKDAWNNGFQALFNGIALAFQTGLPIQRDFFFKKKAGTDQGPGELFRQAFRSLASGRLFNSLKLLYQALHRSIQRLVRGKPPEDSGRENESFEKSIISNKLVPYPTQLVASTMFFAVVFTFLSQSLWAAPVAALLMFAITTAAGIRSEGLAHELTHAFQTVIMERLRRELALTDVSQKRFQALLDYEQRQNPVHAKPMIMKKAPTPAQLARVVNQLFSDLVRSDAFNENLAARAAAVRSGEEIRRIDEEDGLRRPQPRAQDLVSPEEGEARGTTDSPKSELRTPEDYIRELEADREEIAAGIDGPEIIYDGKNLSVIRGAARYFAIGDIHGDLEGLLELLIAAFNIPQHEERLLDEIVPDMARADEARRRELYQEIISLLNLQKGDVLAFAGDFIDRGAYSVEVIEFMIALQAAAEASGARVAAVMGNHDYAFVDLFSRLEEASAAGKPPTREEALAEAAKITSALGWDRPAYHQKTVERFFDAYGTYEEMKARGIPAFFNGLKQIVVVDQTVVTHAYLPGIKELQKVAEGTGAEGLDLIEKAYDILLENQLAESRGENYTGPYLSDFWRYLVHWGVLPGGANDAAVKEAGRLRQGREDFYAYIAEYAGDPFLRPNRVMVGHSVMNRIGRQQDDVNSDVFGIDAGLTHFYRYIVPAANKPWILQTSPGVVVLDYRGEMVSYNPWEGNPSDAVTNLRLSEERWQVLDNADARRRLVLDRIDAALKKLAGKEPVPAEELEQLLEEAAAAIRGDFEIVEPAFTRTWYVDDARPYLTRFKGEIESMFRWDDEAREKAETHLTNLTAAFINQVDDTQSPDSFTGFLREHAEDNEDVRDFLQLLASQKEKISPALDRTLYEAFDAAAAYFEGIDDRFALRTVLEREIGISVWDITTLRETIGYLQRKASDPLAFAETLDAVDRVMDGIQAFVFGQTGLASPRTLLLLEASPRPLEFVESLVKAKSELREGPEEEDEMDFELLSNDEIEARSASFQANPTGTTRAVDLLFNEEDFGGLSERNREAILQAVKSNYEPEENRRSLYIYLPEPHLFTDPVTGEKRTLDRVYLKGVYFDAARPLVPHEGPGAHGFETDKMKVDDNGVLYNAGGQPSPDGAMTAEFARKEYENHLIMHHNRYLKENGIYAAVPLGYGTFGGISFQGQPLGFAVLGMTNGMSALRVDELEWGLTGKVLRRLHDAGISHPFLHSGNLSKSTAFDNRLYVHDMDQSDYFELTEENRTRLMVSMIRDLTYLFERHYNGMIKEIEKEEAAAADKDEDYRNNLEEIRIQTEREWRNFIRNYYYDHRDQNFLNIFSYNFSAALRKFTQEYYVEKSVTSMPFFQLELFYNEVDPLIISGLRARLLGRIDKRQDYQNLEGRSELREKTDAGSQPVEAAVTQAVPAETVSWAEAWIGPQIEAEAGEVLRSGLGFEALEERASVIIQTGKAQVQENFSRVVGDVRSVIADLGDLDAVSRFVFLEMNDVVQESFERHFTSLPDEAVRELQEQVVSPMTEKLRGIVLAGLLGGGEQAFSGGAASIRISGDIHEMLRIGNKDLYNAAYERFRAENPELGLPAGPLVNRPLKGNEAWVLPAYLLEAGEKNVVQTVVGAFFKNKTSHVSVLYNVKTPQEFLAIELARLLGNAKVVGKRLDELSYQFRNFGLDFRDEANIKLVHLDEEAQIEFPAGHDFANTRGVKGSRNVLLRGDLTVEELLKLLELTFSSEVIYAMTGAAEGKFGSFSQDFFDTLGQFAQVVKAVASSA